MEVGEAEVVAQALEEWAREPSAYVAPIRDMDTPIRIRRHGDTASSKNKDTPIRRVYIEAEK